jgi:predicted transcriptional regulator
VSPEGLCQPFIILKVLWQYILKKRETFVERYEMGTMGKMLSALTVLSQSSELRTPAVVGDHVGMTASNTGSLLSRMLDGGTGRKTRQEKNCYQITQKGSEFLANPPPPEGIKREKPAAAPAAAPVTTPTAAPVTTPAAAPVTTPVMPSEEEKEGLIPLKPTFSSP